MNILNPNFTEPEIVTTDDLSHRSYITFYYYDERVREYNAKSIGQVINPNRAKTLIEKQFLLKKLLFELHKALDNANYPLSVQPINSIETKETTIECCLQLLFNAVKAKLRSDLSRTYKRDLKCVYRSFKAFLTDEEAQGPINLISSYRIELFLSQYGSSGTYYMNKRRNLSVLFSAVGRRINEQIKIVKQTPKKKVKAKLHEKYSREQLKPILNFLKTHYYNLYLCCLLTYSSWLRPHEEIRLLTAGDFKNDCSEIHLSGDENKGGKVRVVFIPEYVRIELNPILINLNRNDNIFSLNHQPFNYSYFNTQWSRAYKKMFELGLVFEDQTIYSFRHTAAVALYKKTKDVYLLQKLLGHPSIVVTLNYLRTLGELTTEELRNAAPTLD